MSLFISHFLSRLRFRATATVPFVFAALFLAGGPTVSAETVLHLFAAGPSQRPDVLRDILKRYEQDHPGIKVQISTGAATSEMQRQYLSTLLNARDETYDALLIDIINPAEYSAAGWLEPLDSYFGSDAKSILDDFLPVQRTANRINGKVVALPWVTDAQFLYYRKDLLDKYGLKAPETWSELATTAKTILTGEKNPALSGLSVQGAPIEGTVCTFLLPYWSQGKDFLDERGRLTLDEPAALASFQLWRDLIAQGVLKKNTAETKTGDTTNEFKAGNVVFAVNWGFAWGASQRDTDSLVRDKVGVAHLPRLKEGKHVTSVGGYQWAVSSFSRHKPETVALLRYLTSRETLKILTLNSSLLPTRDDLYSDPEVLAKSPWLKFAYPVVLTAKSRPITARYGEVSDVIRGTTSAVLGGSTSPADGVDEIANRLRRVLR